jgi:cell division septum initiation protein DivIVA
MEDSLSYMNAVSEAGQALNQITALKEAAQMQFEEKKQAIGSEYQLGGEIGLTAAGGYLGKKALGFISEQVKEGASQLASKVGISEETVGKALSGDVSGAIEQGGQELVAGAQSMIGQAVEGVTTTAESMVGQLSSAAESVISEATQAGTGILGRVSSGLENIPSLSTPSISSDSSIGDIYSQGLDDLKSQMGIDDASFRDYTNISLNESRSFSYNTPQSGGGEVEMTDFAAQPTEAAGSAEAATSEAVSTAAAPAAESAGADVAETVGESVGESVAAEVGGDVASAVLGPIGGLVALGLGLWSFFHGEHEEQSTPPPAPFVAALNPSAQFGAQMG